MQNFSVDCSLDILEAGSGPLGLVANPDIAGVGVRNERYMHALSPLA